MQGMGRPRLHRARGRDKGLAYDLATENTLANGLRAEAAEAIRPDLFKIEGGEKFGDGRGHGGLWLAGRPSPERKRRLRQALRAY